MLTIKEERKKFNKLLRLIKKDGHNGLELFYNEYGKHLFLTARNAGCDEYKANNVVDTVLIKIWQKTGKIKGIKNPKAWLATVTRNCAKDELNEVWHLELKEEICSAEDEIEKIVDKDSFEYCLTPLSDYEKELVTLKIVSRYSFQELADYYKKPLPTLTTTFYRAKDKIEKFLKEQKYE